ncbi:nitrogen regulation protein NtrB [Caenibius tardaugens NBRC 16725]|uniref:histidine kinase n=1 Tax=Caenibius tardaugens NBRC 16725 TaxID=1219035 RepID=U2ZZZ9_9SPHN|nr:ATP-binding protein [Caenibius tardaugens]AZI37906.1 PAS domain-containing sensor histidine kinase [Caenibius tardaugens NBRC 16725]GAD50964.1 nitrogen regulation protein NtrB [Caenibius tardaugens NBRC 16725]
MTEAPSGESQLASLNLAVILLDPDVKIASANPAAEQFLGLGMSRIAGKRLENLVRFSELRLHDWLERGDTPISAHAVSISMRNQPDMRVDLTLSPVTGSPGWQVLTFQESASVGGLDDDAGQSVRTPAILAHEIKNPLAAIRGAAQLLARKLTASELSLTGLIVDEVDRIAKLIDRMQSLGREQAEPVAECNLHEVIRRARAVVGAASDDRVQLVEEFDPSIPAVLGNADGLVQVLINLISNARDACQSSQKPQVIIKTRFVSGFVMNAVRLGRSTRLPIQVRVSDNGPGVDAALRDHIFEPFVSSKKNGQGLGLALVKKLIRDMDGRITHERDQAEGWTHFTIHLPMAKPAGGKRAA